MTSRREFLRAGSLSVSALATGSGILRSGEFKQTRDETAQIAARAPLYMVVFDDRFSDSRVFAARAAVLGLPIRSLDQGDATRLWYDDLYHRWQKNPAAIAGMTTAEGLFVMHELGKDAGLRLAFKAEHRIGTGTVEHRLFGHPEFIRRAELNDAGPAWNSRMAELVSHRPRERRVTTTARAISSLPVYSGKVDEAPSPLLLSWTLAPRRVAPVIV